MFLGCKLCKWLHKEKLRNYVFLIKPVIQSVDASPRKLCIKEILVDFYIVKKLSIYRVNKLGTVHQKGAFLTFISF